MIKIEHITSDIRDTLNTIPEVSGRVFPLVAMTKEGVNYPFIVFERTSTTFDSTKDGFADVSVTFNIRIVTATYFEGVALLDKAIEKLQRPHSDHEITYHPRLLGTSEDFSENAYIQTVTFSV